MNENDNKINIVVATDDNYAQHLGVMLCSLLENFQKDRYKDLDIYIIDGSISPGNKKNLKKIIEQYGANAFLKTIDNSKYKGFKISRHLTLPTYYRISIPELLDDYIEKAIYLDCDLIVKKNISKLWNLDISDYAIGAVEDSVFDIIPQTYLNLQIPIDLKYFNSGVMLMNLAYWRKNSISNQVSAFVKSNPDKLLCADQDGLNAILYSRWKPLPFEWNFMLHMFTEKYYKTYSKKPEFKKAMENPSIVHYTAGKPWQYMSKVPHNHKKEYYRYLRKTPWKEYSPPDKNLRNYFKKFINCMKKIMIRVLPKEIINIIRKLKYIMSQKINH